MTATPIHRRAGLRALAGAAALTALAPRGAAAAESYRLRFTAWAGPTISVHIHRPAAAGPAAPLLFVMHGVARGAYGYRDAWAKTAERHGLIIAAPRFDAGRFPGAKGYQLGDGDHAAARSHDAIEPIFDWLRAELGLTAPGYWMYGHSAGAQFVHRFLFRTGGPRLTRAVCANAGWYMAPDPTVFYPYGLRDAGPAAAGLEAALGKRVTVLVGEKDLGRDGSLRKTPETERQGRNRVERAASFFAAARRLAAVRGLAFSWRFAAAPGVGHSNRAIAPFAAAALLEG